MGEKRPRLFTCPDSVIASGQHQRFAIDPDWGGIVDNKASQLPPSPLPFLQFPPCSPSVSWISVPPAKTQLATRFGHVSQERCVCALRRTGGRHVALTLWPLAAADRQVPVVRGVRRHRRCAQGQRGRPQRRHKTGQRRLRHHAEERGRRDGELHIDLKTEGAVHAGLDAVKPNGKQESPPKPSPGPPVCLCLPVCFADAAQVTLILSDARLWQPRGRQGQRPAPVHGRQAEDQGRHDEGHQAGRGSQEGADEGEAVVAHAPGLARFISPPILPPMLPPTSLYLPLLPHVPVCYPGGRAVWGYIHAFIPVAVRQAGRRCFLPAPLHLLVHGASPP